MWASGHNIGMSIDVKPPVWYFPRTASPEKSFVNSSLLVKSPIVAAKFAHASMSLWLTVKLILSSSWRSTILCFTGPCIRQTCQKYKVKRLVENSLSQTSLFVLNPRSWWQRILTLARALVTACDPDGWWKHLTFLLATSTACCKIQLRRSALSWLPWGLSWSACNDWKNVVPI